MSDPINDSLELLKKNHNLILTGAPGTGKTYLARKIACELIAKKYEGFHDKHSEFDNYCSFVQFHPSYDYTDFVEGLRPTLPDESEKGNIGFIRKDGIFKEFCKRPIQNGNFNEVYKKLIDDKKTTLFENEDFKVEIKDGEFHAYHNDNSSPSIFDKNDINDFIFKGKGQKEKLEYLKAIKDFLKNNYELNIITKKDIPLVFIIDEINRGEISKIFGELFFSIDPGYRGEKGKVQTQYQNMIDKNGDDVFKDGFYVHENIYIIGTMNDIDRSVESFDFAMRRRFVWKEIKAEENLGMLDKLGVLRKKAENKLLAINEVIKNTQDLGAAYQIGGAYFLKLENYKDKGERDAFNLLWKYHLYPLLSEYLRGKSEEQNKETWEKLESAYATE